MKTAQRAAWYLGLVIIAAVIAGLGTARAQQGALGANNPWATLLPALRTAPAPGWLRPGMRLTYYSASARIEGGRNVYVPDESCDPDKPGYTYRDGDDDNCFQDNRGKWYRQNPAGAATSGLGFTEVNVVALDQTVAVLDTRSLSVVQGPAVNLGVWGSLELPGASGDWWLNPQALRGALGLSAAYLRVSRVQYPLGNHRYNAIWVTLNSRGRQAYVYDADTGVLLHTSTANQAAPIQGPVQVGESRGGATLLSQNTLMGTRTPAIPWALYPAPDWVRQVTVLHYEGSTTSFVTGGSLPYSTTFQRQAVGANWALYLQTTPQLDATGAPAPAEQGYRAVGSAQIGGLWIPPQGLAQLRQGQVLDDDPITKMRVSVGPVGRTPQGRDAVTIAEDGAGQSSEGVYDRASGTLLSYSYTNKILRTKVQLQLTQTQ
jgi:hypothetical protein